MSATLSRTAPLRHWDPRLEIVWESRWQSFQGSLWAFCERSKLPKRWSAAPFFRDAWVKSPIPKQAMVASLLWHIVLINATIPLGRLAKPRTDLLPPRIEVTWYGPVRDLQPLVAPGPPAKPKPPTEPAKALPPRGADAFHPQQTILSAPLRPTHPRQTLIQPAAAPQPPKILPQLPNVVDWARAPQPARPGLPIDAAVLARLRPKRSATPVVENVSVPQLPNQEARPNALSIAASSLVNPQPSLPMAPSAPLQPGIPQARPEATPVPDIGTAVSHGEDGLGDLIALSTSPGGNAPPPTGNVVARFTISPEGVQSGVPGGSPDGISGATGGTGSAAGISGGDKAIPGPPGVTISSTNRASSFTGGHLGGIHSGSPAIATPLPSKPEPQMAALVPKGTSPTPRLDRLRPGQQPEDSLSLKRFYTLYINMPNLTSATGSWVLNFSEWGDDEAVRAQYDNAADLEGPVPLRKVDPKYPPELIEQHVEGEVILYAIIRADGTVDSLRVLKGLDPQLDLNAMQALALWKFRPAMRHGHPVELEAVVHIPFRAVVPVY